MHSQWSNNMHFHRNLLTLLFIGLQTSFLSPAGIGDFSFDDVFEDSSPATPKAEALATIPESTALPAEAKPHRCASGASTASLEVDELSPRPEIAGEAFPVFINVKIYKGARPPTHLSGKYFYLPAFSFTSEDADITAFKIHLAKELQKNLAALIRSSRRGSRENTHAIEFEKALLAGFKGMRAVLFIDGYGQLLSSKTTPWQPHFVAAGAKTDAEPALDLYLYIS